MSHVSKLDVKIAEKDLVYLRKAAERLGLVFREGQKTHRWYGRWMNDYSADDAAVSQGVDPHTFGTCDHAIACPGNKTAYEVGVRRMENGDYALLYDFWSGGQGMSNFVGAKGERLLSAFQAEKIAGEAQAAGFDVTALKQEADGHFTVTVTPGFGFKTY